MLWRWIKGAWWLQVAVPAVLTAAAWAIQVLVADVLEPWARLTLIIAGSLSALLAFVLPTRHVAAQRRSRAAEIASYRIKMHDILIPASMKASEAVAAPNAPRRREVQAVLEQMIVDFAAEHIGPDRSRSCFFRVEGTPPNRRAVRRAWHGRTEEPRASFNEATAVGTRMMKLIDDRDAELVPDTSVSMIANLMGDAKYQTFICAAVFAGDTTYGVLTVDSLQAGDLTKDDLDLVRVLAQLLATGLAAKS